MNIDKAIDHFKYKFSKSWKPTPSDIEALNSIMDYKERQEDINLQQNESLAKMWIRTFITLCQTKLYNAEGAINEIDADLNKSVYEWCLILKTEIPMLRFNSIGHKKYPAPDYYDIDKRNENNANIIDEFENELTEALLHKPKEQDVIRFVSNHINRIINKFEKNS